MSVMLTLSIYDVNVVLIVMNVVDRVSKFDSSIDKIYTFRASALHDVQMGKTGSKPTCLNILE